MKIFNEEDVKKWRISEDRCPICGGIMLIRMGTCGIFKSCIYFPKCDYSRDPTEEELLLFPGEIQDQ